jgi:hypothetical protein
LVDLEFGPDPSHEHLTAFVLSQLRLTKINFTFSIAPPEAATELLQNICSIVPTLKEIKITFEEGSLGDLYKMCVSKLAPQLQQIELRRTRLDPVRVRRKQLEGLLHSWRMSHVVNGFFRDVDWENVHAFELCMDDTPPNVKAFLRYLERGIERNGVSLLHVCLCWSRSRLKKVLCTGCY